MNRELLARTTYFLFGIACLANGLWLLVDPAGWNDILRMQVEDFGDGAVNLHLMRKLGATYVGVSTAFFWCLVNPGVRPRVVPALALWFSLIAGIQVFEIVSAQVPSHRWVTDAPLILLPPLILLLMLLPVPVPRPARGKARATGKAARPAPASTAGTETGRVKWFDGKKGFGFIIRENGQELFVHFRAIQGEGHRTLRDGERVRFRVGRGDKGPQAEDVTRLDG